MTKEKEVLPNELETIFATAKAKSMKPGKAYRVHRSVAIKLIAAGHASKDRQTTSQKSKK